MTASAPLPPVVPPSDISRTKPLIRLILNQIGRRLTESLDGSDGVERKHKLLLTDIAEMLVPLVDEVPLRYEVLEANQASGKAARGGLTKISRKGAEARLETPVPSLSDLKMCLIGRDGKEIPGTFTAR